MPDISLVVSCNVSDEYMNMFASFFKTSTGNVDNLISPSTNLFFINTQNNSMFIHYRIYTIKG